MSEKVKESFDIYYRAIKEHFEDTGHKIVATCILFSGGNDSTTLAHMFKDVADYAVHINTGIGIEKTREFVRETCKDWGLPLIEKSPPPGSTYRELVLDQGFPGPGHHYKMFQRLKERGLVATRRDFVTNPRKERILFLAGRRRSESKRRQSIPEVERTGSIVWASPIANWTHSDLNAYRAKNDVPKNMVSDLIHMSGECLCGSFAKPDELDEIGYWFPEVKQEIEDLEKEVVKAGHPEKRCKWGWGAYKSVKPSKSGALCSSCDFRRMDLGTAA